MRFFLVFFVVVMALCLHLLYMPYDKGLLNRLELLSILSTLTTQLLNILYYTSVNDDIVFAEWKEVALGLALIAVNVDTNFPDTPCDHTILPLFWGDPERVLQGGGRTPLVLRL